jgi:hypothetical protein
LTWDDVDWDRGRFLVRSTKTENHEDGGERWVPIFPELRPHLEVAWDQAKPGAVHLITRSRDAGTNLRTQLLRIIRRAGVLPWPKLFHNLRASRETELAEVYPLHVVCAWIGNTERIADKHYLQVTEAHFDAAALRGGKSGADSGAPAPESGAATCRNIPGTSSQETIKARKNRAFMRPVATGCETLPNVQYPQGDSNPCLSRERAMS